MADAPAVVVERAGGYLAVQDLGRPGHRADGVPPSGAMDPLALRLANLLAGNSDGAAALEWSVGEAELRATRRLRLAITGFGVRAAIDGEAVALWTSLVLRAGSTLRLEPAPGGRFAYVAVAGGVDVPLLLGSRSTYLPGRFGGHEGRSLRGGDRLAIGTEPAGARPTEGASIPEVTTRLADTDDRIRVVAAAQAELLGDDGWRTLLDGTHRVGPGDRMGYRLEGTPITVAAAAALPSEGAVAGAIQVPGDGRPIVLMPDGPTVGGYPKPAVVASADLGRLAQRPAGAAVRFELVDVEAAQALRRRLEALVTDARGSLR